MSVVSMGSAMGSLGSRWLLRGGVNRVKFIQRSDWIRIGGIQMRAMGTGHNMSTRKDNYEPQNPCKLVGSQTTTYGALKAYLTAEKYGVDQTLLAELLATIVNRAESDGLLEEIRETELIKNLSWSAVREVMNDLHKEGLLYFMWAQVKLQLPEMKEYVTVCAEEMLARTHSEEEEDNVKPECLWYYHVWTNGDMARCLWGLNKLLIDHRAFEYAANEILRRDAVMRKPRKLDVKLCDTDDTTVRLLLEVYTPRISNVGEVVDTRNVHEAFLKWYHYKFPRRVVKKPKISPEQGKRTELENRLSKSPQHQHRMAVILKNTLQADYIQRKSSAKEIALKVINKLLPELLRRAPEIDVTEAQKVISIMADIPASIRDDVYSSTLDALKFRTSSKK